MAILMWKIARRSRPTHGAISGPDGWKTEVECKKAITIMNNELISKANAELRAEVKRSGHESVGAQWAANFLERRIKEQIDFIPIEVN